METRHVYVKIVYNPLTFVKAKKIEEKKVFSSIFIKIKEKTVIFKENMVIFISRLPTFST